MEKYLTSKDFLRQIEETKTVTGKFRLPLTDETVNIDFKNILFKDAEIHGGNFVSGSFFECTFDKVLFQKSDLVGVNFQGCHFKDCIFNRVQQDYQMSNCAIDEFTNTSSSTSHFPDIEV